MQLPDFIKRALAFFDKAEANLTAEQKLSQAQAKITELEGVIAGHVKTIGEKDAKINELQGKLTEAEKAAGEQKVEIKNLNDKVETEKRRANETIASQGLPAGAAPATDPNPDAGGPAKSLVEKLETIKEPRERAKFIRDNYDALFNQARTALKAEQRK